MRFLKAWIGYRGMEARQFLRRSADPFRSNLQAALHYEIFFLFDGFRTEPLMIETRSTQLLALSLQPGPLLRIEYNSILFLCLTVRTEET